MTTLAEQALTAISAAQIRKHIHMLQGVRHPDTAPEALHQAANYIKAEFESLGCETSEHRFLDDGREYRNILGLHRGTHQPEKRILVLAHYDTERTTPGANDNASGVAAVLELARVFQPLVFKASILFVGVSLEELKPGVQPQDADRDKANPGSTRGSRALAAHAKANAWDIQGVINFEEIAFAGDTIAQKTPPGIPLKLPEIGNFIAIVGNDRSAALVDGFIQSIERSHISLPCVPLIVPANGEALPDTRRSDHAPFWDAGYKALMLTDTANFRTPHYHQPSDTLETLNLHFAANVCRAAGGLVIELAGLLEA